MKSGIARENIIFTLCFCLAGDKVLMLRRAKEPKMGKWNGVGGKIEPGETPREAVARETVEETGLDLDDATVTYGGVLSWEGTINQKHDHAGGHVYIARFDEKVAWGDRRATREGLLAWQPITWACDEANAEVVHNIPHFLPPMLSSPPIHCHCTYRDGEPAGLTIEPMTTQIL